MIENSMNVTTKPKRQPFDLEKCKAGAAVETRDGRKFHFAAYLPAFKERYRVIGRVEGTSYPMYYFESGEYLPSGGDHPYDLFMSAAPEKEKRWVNVYRKYCSYSSQEEANRNASPDRIACVEFCEGQGLDAKGSK